MKIVCLIAFLTGLQFASAGAQTEGFVVPELTLKLNSATYTYAAVYEAYLENGPIVAYLIPEDHSRGTDQKGIAPLYRHWVITLPKGMTIRQAFSNLDDLGCGPNPEWTLEHLVLHAINRQFHGFSFLTAPAILVYR